MFCTVTVSYFILLLVTHCLRVVFGGCTVLYKDLVASYIE
jgi:hypothetical protein